MYFALKTRTSFEATINPNLGTDGELVVARDFHSLMALTAFGGFTEIWDWYEKEIGDTSNATQTFGHIVFYGDTAGHEQEQTRT